jgi:hypothetical protein
MFNSRFVDDGDDGEICTCNVGRAFCEVDDIGSVIIIVRGAFKSSTLTAVVDFASSSFCPASDADDEDDDEIAATAAGAFISIFMSPLLLLRMWWSVAMAAAAAAAAVAAVAATADTSAPFSILCPTSPRSPAEDESGMKTREVFCRGDTTDVVTGVLSESGVPPPKILPLLSFSKRCLISIKLGRWPRLGLVAAKVGARDGDADEKDDITTPCGGKLFNES